MKTATGLFSICEAADLVRFDHDRPSIFQRQIGFIQKSGIVTAMVGLLQATPLV